MLRYAVTTLALTLTAAPVLAQSIPTRDPVPARCRQDARLISKAGKPVRATPLDREPNAAMLAAVWRRDSRGCPQPIVLRDDIGAARR